MKLNSTVETTRERILESAFHEFHRNGFQGGSVNRIVSSAGITKGALFHHFKGKSELGYTVIEEIIRPMMEEHWIRPLRVTDDPIRAIRQIIAKKAEEMDEGICEGCPLNNLAQEMSPLDEGFRTRINAIYEDQRQTMNDAFQRGIEAGHVRKTVSPKRVAAFIVAALAGMIGTAKSSQCMELLMTAADGLLDYLDSLKP